MPWLLSYCGHNRLESKDIDHIRVIIEGPAKKATAYNKGLGAYYYSYFNYKTDSAMHLYPRLDTGAQRPGYELSGYEGRLSRPEYRDTIVQMVQALHWRPVGVLGNTPEGATYCGWYFTVQYKMAGQVKYYSVISGISDTLDRFYDFYTRLEKYPWQKRAVDPAKVNMDHEVVSMYKLFGTYDSREVPYLLPDCDSSIDFTKLEGKWRQVGEDERTTDKNRFITLTLSHDGTFSIGKYDSNKFTTFTSGSYSIAPGKRKITYTNTKGSKMTQVVNQLNDSCFSVKESVISTGRTMGVKYNRY